jgi:hypothetical protein
MQAEISMVTMKTLFNNKGISLVVLIVAMTLIAILGASFVSLMGSKQKGFLYQIDSYRALNIANAGVEFAIRYVSDGLSDTTDPDNTFFNNPSASVTRSFGGGEFTFVYDHFNNWITVTGNYPVPNTVSKRDIKLSNFRLYLSAITLVPDVAPMNRPSINIANKQIIIPVINNTEVSINVSRIDVSTNLTGKYLKYIYVEGTSLPVFDYSSSSYVECTYPSLVPCKDTTQGGIYMPTNYQAQFNFTAAAAVSSVMRFTLEFTDSTLSGQYNITFNPQLTKPSGFVKFNI